MKSTRRPAGGLRDRLDAWESSSTLLALDLDGTLHRGRFRRALGLGNVDLAFEIGWLLRPLGLPVPPLRYSLRVAAFARLERRLRRERGDSPAYYAGAIDAFRRMLLATAPTAIVERAARRLPSFAHADLRESLRRIAPRVGSVVIASKAFQPSVDAYVAWLREAMPGLEIAGMGNPVALDEPLRFDSGESKAAALAEWLRARPAIRSCLVVGDTRHDAPMGRVAAELLGEENAALFALASKSDDFAAQADAAFDTWSDLAAFLRPHD